MMIFMLCLKIFLARICDVSIGTFRTMLIVKGKSLIAAFVAFIEVLIWFLVAREALNTGIDSIFIPIAYAGGYATGTFIGGILSKRFIDGLVGVQVVINETNKDIINKIREQGYGVSVVPLRYQKDQNKKAMLYIQINKSKLKSLINLITKLDSNAFITVNETQYIHNGFIK